MAGAAVVLAAALAILALAPGGATVDGGAPPGPQLPQSWQTSTLLRAAHGVLWWVDTRCRTGKVLLAERRIVRGPGNHCDLWPSPDGQTVLATQTDPDAPSPPGRVVVLDGALRPRAITTVRADVVHPPVTWAPGGVFALICADGNDGRPQTVMVDGVGIIRQRLGHVCRPAYLSPGVLATTDDQNVFLGQTKLTIAPQLAAAVHSGPGGYTVEALAAQRDTLLVSVASLNGSLVGPPGAVVVFDRRSGATRAFPVQRGGYANELGISPDGTSLWYRGGGTGDVSILSNGRVLARSIPRVARGYAWSPDGRMLAVALNAGIEIYDLASGRHVTIGELDPARVSWTL
jgi:hypothetical protein